MITSLFISMASGVLGFFASVLPTTPLPSWIDSSITTVGGALNSFNYILPVSTLLLIVGAVVVFETSLWVWHGSLWLYKKIPFLGK